ncbi:uncharacterized protein TRAVEDRAFT_41710 [Trametes versicolor FP-101664 SS1]|uniref:uncharacterized protein n=1 Tax=Trametes versicolor (strain FP-101664) TaxID=717944 RepID=UPI0004621F55|nr:uncharacterized protein TRAVEDRAFT_41710 [Trametes versicolor FP-101664 SS1]EIW64287.1 hypothetical protein TRAVEDRAFT_41710 [Trametes versicolor FP-101664 SS1]
MSSPPQTPTPRTVLRGRFGNHNLPKGTLSRTPTPPDGIRAFEDEMQRPDEDRVVWNSPRPSLLPAFAEHIRREAARGPPSETTMSTDEPATQQDDAEMSDAEPRDDGGDEDEEATDSEQPRKVDKGKRREHPPPSSLPDTPSPAPSTTIPETVRWPSPASDRGEGEAKTPRRIPATNPLPRRIIYSQPSGFPSGLGTRFKPGHAPEGGLAGRDRFLREEDERKGRKRARYVSPPPLPRFLFPTRPETQQGGPPVTPSPHLARTHTTAGATPHPSRSRTQTRQTQAGTRDLTAELVARGPFHPLPPPIPQGTVVTGNYPPPNEEDYWVDMPDLDYGAIDLENAGGSSTNLAHTRMYMGGVDPDVPVLSRQMARAIYGMQYVPPFRDADLSQARNEWLRASQAARREMLAGPSRASFRRTNSLGLAGAPPPPGGQNLADNVAMEVDHAQDQAGTRPSTPAPPNEAPAAEPDVANHPPNPRNLKDAGDRSHIVQIRHPDGLQRGMIPALPAIGDFAFTPRPLDGFPKVYFDEPDALFRDLAKSKQDMLRRQPQLNTVLFLIYNLGYPRQGQARGIAVTLARVVTIITGQQNPHLVPPEADASSRNPPATWAAVDLLPDSVARLLEGRVWSCRAITLIAFPCRNRTPTYALTIAGFIHADLIEGTVRETLEGPLVLPAIERYLDTNPDFAYFETAQAVSYILSTLKVRVEELGSGNLVARIYIEPPTHTPQQWAEWKSLLRSLSFENDYDLPATARDNVYCAGCHGADHPTTLCPFQNVPSWNAPPAGGHYSSMVVQSAQRNAAAQGNTAGPGRFTSNAPAGPGFGRGRGFAKRGSGFAGKRGRGQ